MATEEVTLPIPAGTEVIIERSIGGAPTMFVDGLAGISLSNHIVKIDLFEQMTIPRDDGKASGRHTITLAMPSDSFLKIMEALQKVVEEHFAAKPEAE